MKNHTIEFEDFDISSFLTNDEIMAEFLQAAIEDEDPAVLAAALGEMVKAKGVTYIAEETGLKRESLYKALRPGSQPRLDTIRRVLSAMGLKLEIKPIKAPSKKTSRRVHVEEIHA